MPDIAGRQSCRMRRRPLFSVGKTRRSAGGRLRSLE